MTTKDKPIQFEPSSDNIYEDLGYRKPDEMLIKAGLALKISKIIKSRKFTQIKASKIMDISQDKVSNLLSGNFSRISERKLMDCLTRLGYDVKISIKPSSTSVGHLMIA